MASQAENVDDFGPTFRESCAKNSGLVAFESELPDDLLDTLNDTYQKASLPEKSVSPQSELSWPKPPPEVRNQKRRSQPRFCLGRVWSIILPIMAMCCAMIYCFEASKIREPLLNAKNPKAVIKNLARRSQGAHIIEGYTSPPAKISWFPWSSKYKADPECLIRSSDPECWPFRGETAIGIGLEAPSYVHIIRANMSYTSTSDPSTYEHLVRDVGVFSVNSHGTIQQIGQSAHNSTEVHLMPGQSTFKILIIRVRILLLGKPWSSALGCLLNIEVMGIPEEDSAVSQAQLPLEPTILSLDSL